MENSATKQQNATENAKKQSFLRQLLSRLAHFFAAIAHFRNFGTYLPKPEELANMTPEERIEYGEDLVRAREILKNERFSRSIFAARPAEGTVQTEPEIFRKNNRQKTNAQSEEKPEKKDAEQYVNDSKANKNSGPKPDKTKESVTPDSGANKNTNKERESTKERPNKNHNNESITSQLPAGWYIMPGEHENHIIIAKDNDFNKYVIQIDKKVFNEAKNVSIAEMVKHGENICAGGNAVSIKSVDGFYFLCSDGRLFETFDIGNNKICEIPPNTRVIESNAFPTNNIIQNLILNPEIQEIKCNLPEICNNLKTIILPIEKSDVNNEKINLKNLQDSGIELFFLNDFEKMAKDGMSVEDMAKKCGLTEKQLLNILSEEDWFRNNKDFYAIVSVAEGFPANENTHKELEREDETEENSPEKLEEEETKEGEEEDETIPAKVIQEFGKEI